MGSGEGLHCSRPLPAAVVAHIDECFNSFQAWDALATLVRVGSKYDRDGIDIHFLNQRKADRSVQV